MRKTHILRSAFILGAFGLLGAAAVGVSLRAAQRDECPALRRMPVRAVISSLVQLQDGSVAVATSAGDFLTIGRGDSRWTPRRSGVAPGGAMAEMSAGRLLSLTATARTNRGVYLSDPPYVSWRRVSCAIGGSPAVDPRNRRVAYFAEVPEIGAVANGHVVRTVDSGREWEGLPQPAGATRQAGTLVNALAISPRTGQLLVATEEGGLLRSSDRGRTWIRDMVAFGGSGVKGVQATDIAFGDGGRITWLGTRRNGIFRQGRDGSWKQMGFRGREVSVVETVAKFPRLVIVSVMTQSGRFAWMISRDSGRRWTSARDLPKNISWLVSGVSEQVFAVASDRVFYSRDAARTWVPLPPLPPLP